MSDRKPKPSSILGKPATVKDCANDRKAAGRGAEARTGLGQARTHGNESGGTR